MVVLSTSFFVNLGDSVLNRSFSKARSGRRKVKLDDRGQYEEIEELLDKRALLDGDTIYLCRWKGMDPSQDTWPV